MQYKNPCATADIIVERNNKILLIRRKHEPFRDKWAIPGGFINCDKETLREAGARELEEETGLIIRVENLELFNEYSSPDRDPRGHVISHVYIAREWTGKLKAGDDAKKARFFSLCNLPLPLAFDHEQILQNYQTQKQLKGGKRKDVRYKTL